MNKALLRVYSQVYKNFRLLFENPFRFMDVTFWPLILLFSLTLFVSYFGQDPKILVLVVLGVMGWRAVYHANMEIASNYMEEYWSQSLTHLFITPIRPLELVLGSAVSGLFKFLLVFAMYYLVTFFLYGFVIPDPLVFAIACVFLFLFGLSLGMIVQGVMFFYASEAFSLSFTVPDVFVLLSAAYYPLSVLPQPVQAFSLLLPSTHAFLLIKSTLGLATVDYGALVGLSVVWFAIGYAVMMFAFSRAKKTGRLVRVA